MARDERKKQVVVAASILAGMAAAFILIVAGRRLPGLAGEFFAKVAGIITTPFLMETSVCIFGFIIVMLLNKWREARDGDELVYLDELEQAAADSKSASQETGLGKSDGSPL